MLILKKKSTFQEWYEQNKQRLAAKRKTQYAEDATFRERALETSRRRRRGELRHCPR
jgi:hypothetical protein